MQVQKELPGEGLRSQISHFGYSGHNNRAKDNGREAEGDLDRRPETVPKLGQQLVVYTASNYFFFWTTGTIRFNTCPIDWNNAILPEKMLENDLTHLIEENEDNHYPGLGLNG